MDLANLPQYQCHKRVRAVKVREIRIEQRHSLHVTLIPEDPAVSPFEVNEAYMQKHEPRAPGYFVLHDDGYQSWSPVEAFEAGYARIAK